MGAECSLSSTPAASTALGSRPTYSRASSRKPNSRAPLHSQRKGMSSPDANFCASASSSAPLGCSNDSSTLEAFIFERRPCGLSTWNDAGAWARTAPTFRSPSSSYSSCTAELDDARQVARKALQAVVAAVDHHLLGARIARHRLAIVEHLVAGLDQQKVAPRRDARHVEPLPFTQVRLGKLVRLGGVEVFLRAEVGAQPDVRLDRR